MHRKKNAFIVFAVVRRYYFACTITTFYLRNETKPQQLMSF